MTEQSVKREITGPFRKKRTLTVVCFFAAPAILLLTAAALENPLLLIVFIIIIIGAVPFEIFFYRFFFRVEFDYTLVGDVFSVSRIRNGRYGRTVAEINLRESGTELRESNSGTAAFGGGSYRRVLICCSDETAPHLYGLIYREEGAALNDLVVFSPDENFVRKMKRYVR